MKPGGSRPPCPQNISTGPYPRPDQSSTHIPILFLLDPSYCYASKEFPNFYGTRWSFPPPPPAIKPRHWALPSARPIQYTPSYPFPFRSILMLFPKILLPSLPSRVFAHAFPTEIQHAFLYIFFLFVYSFCLSRYLKTRTWLTPL
jgi:hypothetical protein